VNTFNYEEKGQRINDKKIIVPGGAGAHNT
jgi:hypothetical protein